MLKVEHTSDAVASGASGAAGGAIAAAVAAAAALIGPAAAAAAGHGVRLDDGTCVVMGVTGEVPEDLRHAGGVEEWVVSEGRDGRSAEGVH